MLALVLIAVAFGAALWWTFYSNTFVVEPHQRERIVVYSILNGEVKVLEEGTHSLAVWWVELASVSLNREPVHIPPTSGKPGDEFRSADGILGLIEYRFDIVAGRRYNLKTGQLLYRNGVDNVPECISNEVVKLAVTRIDYDKHVERVLDIAKAAIEKELGSYTADELFRPSETKGGVKSPRSEIYGVQPKKVEDAASLYAQLSQAIEARANKMLTFVGINIIDMDITNLKPKSEAYQDDLEKAERTRRIVDAAEVLTKRIGGDKITTREALVATDPNAFAEVTKAMAIRDAAKPLAEALSDGLRNFGQGSKKEEKNKDE